MPAATLETARCEVMYNVNGLKYRMVAYFNYFPKGEYPSSRLFSGLIQLQKSITS